MSTSHHAAYVVMAIEKAKESVAQGGFPAGAIVVKDGHIIGEGISIGNILHDPTSHGEMSSIRSACQNIKTSDLSGATLYASMQPCLMCLGAAMWAGINEIVYACPQSKVAAEYYGGHYNTDLLIPQFIKPIRTIQLVEFEADSLEVVAQWEELLAKT